jgi:hypothetical protein
MRDSRVAARRFKPGLILGSIVAVVAVGVAVLWILPALLTREPSGGMSAPDRLKAVNDVRTTLVGLLVGSGAVATAWFTSRGYFLSREGQVTDRYTKAVGQLGEQASSVRVGGIYALERIADDSFRDRRTIIYVLGSFIRERSRTEPRADDQQPTEDVLAAVRVVGRLLVRSDARLNLQGADLRNADLSDLPAQQIRLEGANLQGAKLPGPAATRR